MLGRQSLLTSCEINTQICQPHETGFLLLAGELKSMFLVFICGVRGLGEKQHKNKTH